MNEQFENVREITRRHFFGQASVGIGAPALAALLKYSLRALPAAAGNPLLPRHPHFRPKAKSIIYLHMAGSPPQHELFDYKPALIKHNDQPCPEEYLKGERFAFIKGTPKLLGTPYKFSPQGKSGTLISELLPHLSQCADDMA